MAETIEQLITALQKEVGMAYPLDPKRDGRKGIALGHCKKFLQTRIKELTGIQLPSNSVDPQKMYAWQDTEMQRIKRIGCFGWLEDCEGLLKRGHILQIHWVKKRISQEYRKFPFHTALVTGLDEKSIHFIDSNWVAPFQVGEHSMTRKLFDNRAFAFTVYELDLQ